MISGLTSTDQHVVVYNAYSAPPYVNTYASTASAPCLGYVRVNGTNYETYDGSMWQNIPLQPASVGLTPQASMAISWAIEKQIEESRAKELAEQYPELKQAKEHHNTVLSLILNMEKEKAQLKQQLDHMSMLNAKIVEDVNRVTAERNEYKEKLDCWSVLNR